MSARMIGRYIVTDPEICHGQPTFRGTRVVVQHVSEQVADGMDWESIIAEWRGRISKDAIAEAVGLAGRAFLDHAPEYTASEYVLEPAPA
jgi:uncharacterized protein (DUF433 family)